MSSCIPSSLFTNLPVKGHLDPVTLLEPSSPWTWRFWEATLNLSAGTYQLAVRAWDSAGRTQLQEVRLVWNWQGSLNHA
jgi:molybdenum-dependent oxidoreductase-like protein